MAGGCLPIYDLYQRPGESLSEARSGIAVVSVAIDSAPPEIVDVRPARGPWEGFKRGFVAGAGFPVVAGVLAPVPGSALLGFLVAPVTGVAGSVYGAFKALPAEPVDAVTRILAATVDRFAALKLREKFKAQIIERGNAHTRHTFVEAPSGTLEPGTDPAISRSPVDTVLRIALVRAGLKGVYQIDPPSSAFLEIEARLIRADDGTELLAAKVSCYSDRHSYLKWGADDGQAFVDALVRCVPLLAEKVIDDLFLVYPPPAR